MAESGDLNDAAVTTLDSLIHKIDAAIERREPVGRGKPQCGHSHVKDEEEHTSCNETTFIKVNNQHNKKMRTAMVMIRNVRCIQLRYIMLL